MIITKNTIYLFLSALLTGLSQHNEVFGFIAVMLVPFSQISTVGNETKQMSSITIPLIESVNTIDENVYKQSLSVKELFITVSAIVNQDSEKTSFYEKYKTYFNNQLIKFWHRYNKNRYKNTLVPAFNDNTKVTEVIKNQKK